MVVCLCWLTLWRLVHCRAVEVDVLCGASMWRPVFVAKTFPHCGTNPLISIIKTTQLKMTTKCLLHFS